MWSKVSGSDSVWVNTKDSLVPFFFSATRSSSSSSSSTHHPPPLSHAPTFPLSLSLSLSLPPPPHTPATHPFPKIYEGNVWIWLALWTRCQTTSERLCWGSRLHGDVFLSSPCSSSSSCALLLLLLRRLPSHEVLEVTVDWHMPSITATRLTPFSSSCGPHVHSRLIRIRVNLLTGYCEALWGRRGWGRLRGGPRRSDDGPPTVLIRNEMQKGWKKEKKKRKTANG